MDKPCHAKVYSGMYQAKIPARWDWICEDCGEVGFEELKDKPAIELDRYVDIYVKHRGEGDAGWLRRIQRQRKKD